MVHLRTLIECVAWYVIKFNSKNTKRDIEFYLFSHKLSGMQTRMVKLDCFKKIVKQLIYTMFRHVFKLFPVLNVVYNE